MASPTPYNRTYSFNDFQASNPSSPLPGVQVDNELENVELSLNEAIDAINDVRRSDGALKNGIVTVDSLSPQVAAGVGAGALASAEAAASSASAAADSAEAAASSAGAASGYAGTAATSAGQAMTYRNEAETEKTLAQTARTGAQTARDFAAAWATAAEGEDVDDGVNPVGKSAYHWAQVALGAAEGNLPDGSVSTSKIADGAVTLAKLATEVTDEIDNKADAAATAAALALRVRVDEDQPFSAGQQAQAKRNMGINGSAAYNHIIDGRFDFWSVGTSISASGYGAADMWLFRKGTGATATFSQQTFALGQTEVPGNPKYFARIAVSAAGSDNTEIKQRLADVTRLAGVNAKFQVYAKASKATTININHYQVFGTGGAPSATVGPTTATIDVGTSWAPLECTLAIPSVTGKTLGTNKDDYTGVDISIPHTAGAVTLDLCLVQLHNGNTFQEFVFDRAAEQYAIDEYFCFFGPVTYAGVTDSSSLTRGELQLRRPIRGLAANASVGYSGTFRAIATGTDATATTLSTAYVSPGGCSVRTEFTGTAAAGTSVLIGLDPLGYIYADARF